MSFLLTREDMPRDNLTRGSGGEEMFQCPELLGATRSPQQGRGGGELVEFKSDSQGAQIPLTYVM